MIPGGGLLWFWRFCGWSLGLWVGVGTGVPVYGEHDGCLGLGGGAPGVDDFGIKRPFPLLAADGGVGYIHLLARLKPGIE